MLKPWTKRQTWPSCGELLKELMAEQTARQRRSYYLQHNIVLIVQAASHQVQPTVQYFKPVHTYFFKRDPSSDEGNQEEAIGDGTNIHRGPCNETQSRAVDSKAFGPDKLNIF